MLLLCDNVWVGFAVTLALVAEMPQSAAISRGMLQ